MTMAPSRDAFGRFVFCFFWLIECLELVADAAMVEMAAARKLFWDGWWAIQRTARKLLSTLVCQLLLASTQYMLFLEQV